MKKALNWADLPDVINVREASAVARVSKEQIYQLAKRDGFPCARLGKRILIPRDLFRKWIETNGRVSDLQPSSGGRG